MSLYGRILLLDLAPTLAGGLLPAFKTAALHNCRAPQFGFHHDNYIGSTPQPNPWTSDGFEFFGEQRLLFQARLAQRRGLLGSGETAKVERLAARLPQLLPAQPASLLHGDLWTGNALSDMHGAPAITGVRQGWAELFGDDRLFGSFRRAGTRSTPAGAGLRRYDLYNLHCSIISTCFASTFGAGGIDFAPLCPEWGLSKRRFGQPGERKFSQRRLRRLFGYDDRQPVDDCQNRNYLRRRGIRCDDQRGLSFGPGRGGLLSN
jgi:hypothetical protein